MSSKTEEWAESPLGVAYSQAINASAARDNADAVQTAVLRLLTRHGGNDIPPGYLGKEIGWAKLREHRQRALGGLTEVPKPKRQQMTAASSVLVTERTGACHEAHPAGAALGGTESVRLLGLVEGSRDTAARDVVRVVSGDAEAHGSGGSLFERGIGATCVLDEEPDLTALHFDLATAVGFPLTPTAQSRKHFLQLLVCGAGSLDVLKSDWATVLDAGQVAARLAQTPAGREALGTVGAALHSVRTRDVRECIPFIVLAVLREFVEYQPSPDGLRRKLRTQAVGGNATNGGRANNARRVAARLLAP